MATDARYDINNDNDGDEVRRIVMVGHHAMQPEHEIDGQRWRGC
ncbi:DUF4331 domain-containing protein [Lentzea flaviverrucosa]|nr:DUF4331 domain-containing protein [Lentzea flaviverrucosa]